MPSSALFLATKDNCSGQLASGISAGSLSIALQTGQGASFPQPYNGTASSLGTATTLNCTGILATIGSGAAGKMIRNLTDGSIAFIKSVATNSVTTMSLTGGTNNVWSNADAWRIDEFIITLAVVSTATSGSVSVSTITSYEQALIIARSSDTLTVATGGRGYNGTTAQSFSTNDYVYLFVTSSIVEGIKSTVYEIAKQIDTQVTSILNGSFNYAVATGSSNVYAASFPSIVGPIAAGMDFYVKANFTNTASATLTPTLAGTAQSPTTMKKLDGATNLASGDSQSGQVLHLRYDGTNLQLLSPVGNPPASISSIGFYGDGSDSIPIWTSGASLSPASEYRYTTATLPVSQTLTVSSVITPLVIHNTGDVTINGTVDLNGKGAAGGSGGSSTIGATGTAGNSLISGWTVGAGGGGTGGTPTSGGGSGASLLTAGAAGSNGVGTGGTAGARIDTHQFSFLSSIERGIACGAGGGGGGSTGTSGGNGGAGGGALFWLIGGNLTLGASSIVRANGANGANSTAAAGGGGGGGGGGTIIILVAGSITNSGVTASASGGSGGTATGGGGAGATGGAGRVLIYSLSTGTLITA
jgi:hypothetical protein